MTSNYTYKYKWKTQQKKHAWKGELTYPLDRVGKSYWTIYPEELAVWLATP
jgi:hypothetical protein